MSCTMNILLKAIEVNWTELR